MSIHDKKNNSTKNIINQDQINDKISSIIDMIVNDERYEEGKNEIRELFKQNISNEKIIKQCLTIINNIIDIKGNSKHKILSIIPEICQINPNQFYNHVDLILSIFQRCLEEDNSQFYSQISQYFGDITKILLNELNSQNYNTYTNSENDQNKENLLLIYSKFMNFCLSNIKSENTGWQICGTLCLTSFIENCSFNYINDENFKCIFDIICSQINNPNFPGKLEILNCFISLVFCSEEKYIPYSIATLNIIIQFIEDEEWLIRKFSLNIIYTMLYYCKKELLEKKDFIIDKLKVLEKETNYEVKETVEQIYRMLKEDESMDKSYNNRILFLSESGNDSNNSKFSSTQLSKNFNCSMSNKEFKISEEEKNKEENAKTKKLPKSGNGKSKKKFQNSFIKNNKHNNDKSQIKTKSDKKRKNFNKSNDIIIDNFVNNSSSKNFFPKLMNHSNNNIKGKNIDMGINSHNHKKRNVFSNNIVNKTRSDKNIPSRNSVNKFYGIQKKNPISMILKKNNILYNNINNINNKITSETQNMKGKAKDKDKYNYQSPGKSQKSIIGLKNSYNNLTHTNHRKRNQPVYNSIKNQKMYNIKNNIQTHKNKGRNDYIKQNKLMSNTYLNNSMQERNVLTLNKMPSFGPKSEEERNSNKYIYCDDNSNNIEESKVNKNKKDEKNKHNYSFDGKLNNSKKYFFNTSGENDILNFTGNESRENIECENKQKNRSMIYDNHYKQNKSKVKFNPMLIKFENNYNNNGKIYSKYHNNNAQKNKRVTKLNKKKISTELNNNNYIYIYNKNNYEKDSKLQPINSKNKFNQFSPGNELKDNSYINKLFHSFSNKQNEKKGYKINNKINNKVMKNNNKKIGHKVNHSLQINNDIMMSSKKNNLKINNNNNSKINDKKKKNNNNSCKNIQENKNTNNNIIFHNGDLSIIDNKAIEETNNDINFELLSKKDDSIELKFKEYKNETSKIIDDLKSQVNFLKTTLGNFEEQTKKKEKLINQVKNKNYIQAFETAVDLGNIQDIYYVIKKYQLLSEKDDIPANVLGDVMKILCEDILSCENLRLIIMFIITNICDKNIIFDEMLNKEIFNVFNDLYNKREELCLMNKDISNIIKITNYFQ
jgi:hypothetical protein